MLSPKHVGGVFPKERPLWEKRGQEMGQNPLFLSWRSGAYDLKDAWIWAVMIHVPRSMDEVQFQTPSIILPLMGGGVRYGVAQV
jgi:hypothetical protein